MTRSDAIDVAATSIRPALAQPVKAAR